jgi:hypothetical protein
VVRRWRCTGTTSTLRLGRYESGHARPDRLQARHHCPEDSEVAADGAARPSRRRIATSRPQDPTRRPDAGGEHLAGDRPRVHHTEESRPIEPRNLLRILQAAASRIGLTGVGVHTLRHSHASAALEAGRRAQDRVRTPRPQLFAITGDVYAHVSDAAARRRSTSSPRCSESDRCYRSYTRCYTTPREHPADVG